MEYLYFLMIVGVVSANYGTYQNDDGSYSFGGAPRNLDGNIASSVLSLLTKTAGYTANLEELNEIPSGSPDMPSRSQDIPSSSQIQEEKPAQRAEDVQDLPENRVNVGALLAPHTEILELVEVLLRLKGELARRANDVLTDNYDLIRSVYFTLVSKIGSLHSFTLIGIGILRKILEFAVVALQNWQIPLPSVSIDVEKPSFGGFSFSTGGFGR